MSKEFPHLDDTRFPDLQTANVYKYRNELDYDRYEVSTKIKMLNVPWCGDYDNAVYFETREERDKWFDSQKGTVKEMPTMFRLYADGDIKVELPIDECMGYNYVMIDYGKAPYQAEETKYGKMFYFISDMKQDSVNTTRLQLAVDYWTTYIYDMGITYVNLERGHAPMAKTDADMYLDNPLDNSEYLLTDDVSYGYLQRVTSTENVIFNDYTGDLRDMTLGFQTSASMDKSWQIDGNPCIPTAAFESSQAFSSVDPFVIEDLTQWEAFRDTVMEQCPQFFETVKGMFIVPKKLLTYSTDFDFCGFACHFLASHGDKNQGGIKLEKGMFGYPEDYADIAKLYTYPYAAIEVTDFKGGTMQIRVEDTAGSVEVRTMMCDMYPFLGIEAYLTGIGSGGRSELRFQNNFTHTMTIGGRYYDFSTKWNIPVFSVQLTPQADWELNGKIGADTANDNAKTTADTNQGCINASNKAITENFGTTKEWTKSRNDITCDFMDYSTDQATGDIDASVGKEGKLSADMRADVRYMRGMKDIQQEYAAGAAVNNAVTTIAGAAISIAAAEATGGLSLVPGAAHAAGAAAHAANITVGAALSGGRAATALNAGVNLFGTAAGYNIFISKNDAMLEWSLDNAVTKTLNAITYAKNMNAHTKTYNTDVMNGELETAETITNKNTKTSDDNAKSVSDASKKIADANYAADRNQTYLSNHPTFGQLTGTPDIISKPFGLSFNAVTQSRNAIRQAAEQFMRYGYALNMQWRVRTFNVMPKFSYWKCSSVYCSDSGVYEGGQAMVKSILERGITVWRNPDDVGVTSIYENR